jgi:hypothetical protein
MNVIAFSQKLIAQGTAFGKVDPPKGVDLYNAKAGGGDAIGILLFVSNLVKLLTVIGGIWVMFNFVSAGLMYITSSGDKGVHTKVRDQMTMSIIGLILIVAAYTFIGIAGFLIFGDASYILNPKITGPT